VNILTKKVLIKKIIKNKWGYIFLIPWALLFLIFIFSSFIIGFILSLYEYDFANYNFVFLKNFRTLFKDHIFLNSILTTLKFALIIVPASIALSLWISNMINDSGKVVQSVVKAGFYIPAVVSSVAIVVAWKWIFNPAYGLSTYVTTMMGVTSIDWYGNPTNAFLLISVLLIFLFIGQPIILYSAAMGSIPISYYEAARIDGASRFQEFFKITLPLLKPTTLFITVTMTISSLQVFEIPLLLTGGGPQFGTTTVLNMLYKTAFEYTKFGLAASMGVVLFMIIGLVALIQFKYLKSDVQY
jgi:ABC-type sugar transport system permease subunit